jgi:transposase
MPSYYDQTRMTAPQRDAKIKELHDAGYSTRAIGKIVGMSGAGVYLALQRIKEGRPGRDPRA